MPDRVCMVCADAEMFTSCHHFLFYRQDYHSVKYMLWRCFIYYFW